MRELTKSFLNLSWAMSLFGARNLGNLLSGGEAGKKAVEDFEAVTDTIVKRLGESFRQAFNTGEKLQDEIVDTAFRFCLFEDKEKAVANKKVPGADKLSSVPAIFGASSGANEEVLVVFTRGQGTFSADKRFIALDHVMFDIEGREVGFHQGVWEALFHDPRELLVRPAPPAGPMNQPVGPVPPAPVAANTKAIWAFKEGHSIESVGPAASHLIPLSDGSFLFLVSTGQIITGGTGRWEGAYGLTQSLGATHVPAGVDLFSDEITTFPATTFDTFKIKVVEGSGGAKRSSVSVSTPASPPPANTSSTSAKPIVPPPSTPAMAGAHSAADEEVVVVYTRGQGTFSPDKRFIALNHDLFDVHGRKVGKHEGVWEALFSDPRELLSQPAPPTGPMNQPVGPVPASPVAANTKAIWAFDDGSSIESVGPAASHLVPLADGSFLFLVSTGQVITGGTGRWEGAYGLTQSLGATHVPAGVDLFSGDVTTFPATTFDTFKIKIAKGGPGGASGPDKRLDPASCVTGIESHFAEVKGSKMHYLDIGEGHPVIFLHGNPTWSYLWRNILPTVAENARCLAPDLIGMGLSDKPDINYGFADQVEYLSAWIDKLELDDFTLVLHDWGCIVGFYYAMKNEEKVRKLAFMEAMYKPYAKWADFPEPLRKTFKMFRTPDIGYENIVVNNMFIEQLLPGSMLRKLSPTEMDCYRAPFADPASRKVIWRFAQDLPIGGRPKEVAKATSEYAKWLIQTELPKLLLYAEPGAINTQADVEWMESNLKNLETVSLGKGIHFHQEDQPEAIAQALARWL